MRRLWAVSAAIVVCLALGGPVMAQEASPAADGPVLVTATQVCTWAVPGGVPTGTCTYTASDPRVTGPLTLTIAEAVGTPDDHYLETFDATITGPDGIWMGRYWVIFDWPANVSYPLSVLTGDGAYEGWTYVASGQDNVPDANTDLVGVLYQGPPPPGITNR
jgi:hypothetical protein